MTSSRRPALHDRPSSCETSLGTTTCSKGHVHPPWNMTGVLRIAKCESVCGFCKKETKTASNLRKHVAIHIKNEGLNLSIAEGSSGRGKLEMPTAQLDRCGRSSSHISSLADDSDSMDADSSYKPSVAATHSESFSPSAVLMSMASRPSQSSSSSSYPSYTFSASACSGYTTTPTHSPSPFPSKPLSSSHCSDPFRTLREHNISTKHAWTVVPASEGFRILDLCKSLSVAGGEDRVPCYNRETIFDEEWQAHMKDVHGVFLLWPETWMRRIEVLDLDAFGGDIGACNEVIMDS